MFFGQFRFFSEIFESPILFRSKENDPQKTLNLALFFTFSNMGGFAKKSPQRLKISQMTENDKMCIFTYRINLKLNICQNIRLKIRWKMHFLAFLTISWIFHMTQEKWGVLGKINAKLLKIVRNILWLNLYKISCFLWKSEKVR